MPVQHQRNFNDRSYYNNERAIKERYLQLIKEGKSTPEIISLIRQEKGWNAGYIEYHIVYMKNRKAIEKNPNDKFPGQKPI